MFWDGYVKDKESLQLTMQQPAPFHEFTPLCYSTE